MLGYTLKNMTGGCHQLMFVNPLREVVVNMLLRLVEHSRVMVLLTYVLDCYRRNMQKWQEVCYICVRV